MILSIIIATSIIITAGMITYIKHKNKPDRFIPKTDILNTSAATHHIKHITEMIQDDFDKDLALVDTSYNITGLGITFKGELIYDVEYYSYTETHVTGSWDDDIKQIFKVLRRYISIADKLKRDEERVKINNLKEQYTTGIKL